METTLAVVGFGALLFTLAATLAVVVLVASTLFVLGAGLAEALVRMRHAPPALPTGLGLTRRPS